MLLLVAVFVVGLSGEVLAHISTRSPYQEGVPEKELAAVSNTLFVLGQLLGWAFLAAVLHASRQRPLWADLGAALGIQTALSVLLFLPCTMLFSFATLETHISYSGYEILFALRPEVITGAMWLSGITLALGWGLSALVLLLFRGLRRRWLVGLLHVLVFHPFVFPVGAVVGLMYVLYLWQPAVRQPG